MKKLFPIALLMCVVFSMSSFAPAVQPLATKPATLKRVISWPITGQTFGKLGAGQGYGTLNYTVVGSGTTPTSVSLYNAATNQFIGTWWFSGAYAGDASMFAETEISAFQFVLNSSSPSGYTLTIISPWGLN